MYLCCLYIFPSVSLKYEPFPLSVMEHLPRANLTFLAEQLELPSCPRPHTCTEWGQCAGVCKGWQNDTSQLQEHLEDQDLNTSAYHYCLYNAWAHAVGFNLRCMASKIEGKTNKHCVGFGQHWHSCSPGAKTHATCPGPSFHVPLAATDGISAACHYVGI